MLHGALRHELVTAQEESACQVDISELSSMRALSWCASFLLGEEFCWLGKKVGFTPPPDLAVGRLLKL